MPVKTLNDENLHPRKLPEVPEGDEIVISGIAGRFPECNNLYELRDKLMNKVDLITCDDRRWKQDISGVPHRTGKVNNIEKFDALFFGVHAKQAQSMDPMCRMLLEHAYEAIIDSGINPKMIRGSRTGVFVGASLSESEKTWFYENAEVNGFGIMGCSRAMLSNRISYYLGITGPSYTIDTACSSSMYAMEHAYRAIREGLCDAAIVGGSHLCLHPCVSIQFYNLGVLSPDGTCKTFDEAADGYARSESICVAFLQKAKDAKRIYATYVHGKTNCDGYKEKGVTFPSSYMQSVLLKEFYMECGIPPSVVNYIEAHGTGTKVGDPEEVNAIDEVIGSGRTKKAPLLIGSVKSNLGHTEPVSGLVSISKVILAMESGIIPPNINFKNCKSSLISILEGRLKVVSEPHPLKGDYIGINSFGFGGANAHILLKANQKKKINNGAPNDDLSRLVFISGRTEDAVSTILEDTESKPVDVEYIALLHNIHKENINNHLYRGYTILPARGITKKPVREIKILSGIKRCIWFVFSGMGSQWPGMGEELLRIPVFADTIEKCDAVLKPLGINIYSILTSKEKKIFDNVLNSFVGIAAVQIGLVNVLRSLNIEPDNIIGHSVGELGCAYADGCFTSEQMILSAYFRGLASIETKIIHGSMAAIGMGYKDIIKLCPIDIEVACHNSNDSATISGPSESVKNFIAELQAKGIFAKEVPCSNIPYHSRYIAAAGTKLRNYLQKVIPNPKLRSEKWVSTSIPQDKWDTDLARYSSADYHTNNLLNPVLFEEISAFIPKNAIAIEIAPHGLLQAILKRSLHPSVINISLTQRGNANNIEVLLQSIGKIFNEGCHPQIANIYPPVQFPVSRGTPMISPFIKWQHSEDYYVASFKDAKQTTSSERIINVSIVDQEFEAMAGHVIDGRNLFPATGYLFLVWETFSTLNNKKYFELPIVFEDIRFQRATTIPQEGSINLTLVIQKGSGRFEISEGGAAVVSGQIRLCPNLVTEKLNLKRSLDDEEIMTSRDIYKELRLRGYHYTGLFRSIKKASISGRKAHIAWHNNWIAFIDNMLQLKLLSFDTRGLFVPTAIRKMVIDPDVHFSHLDEGEKEFEVTYEKLHDVIRSAGVEIWGLKASAIAKRKPAGYPVLEVYTFVPFLDGAEVTLPEISRLISHIALENQIGIKIRTIEFIDESDNIAFEHLLSPWISESLANLPMVQGDVLICSSKSEFNGTLSPNISMIKPTNTNGEAISTIVIGHRLLTKDRYKNLNILLAELKPGGFILSREEYRDLDNFEENARDIECHIVMLKESNGEIFILLKRQMKMLDRAVVVKVDNYNLNWVDEMRKVMSDELEKGTINNTRIFFIGQGNFDNGLMGLINCLRKEPGGEAVRGIFIQDLKAPEFSLQHPLYAKQIEKDLVAGVLREGEVWGNYRHLPLPPLIQKPVRHAWVNQKIRGDLNSLTWLEGPIQPNVTNKNIVNIVFSSINFKDVMLSTGKLPIETVSESRQGQECIIGFEYSGINSDGKRVMGLIENRGLANVCMADHNLQWEVPDSWTLEESATVPCVYGTCYYGLFMKGKIKKGQSILIHAGTGGIGQAAINLALHVGCEIFTTVGTPEKKQFIQMHFPQIPDSNIGNSRDTSFEQMIMEKTNGRGVDIVLNSLAEEKLRASINCVAWGGQFLEIGKFDLSANNPLGMECFLREISVQGIMLDRLLTDVNENKLELKTLMAEGLTNGAIKPLVRTVFSKDHVEQAFRYMAAGKHVGKVLIKIRDESESMNTPTLAHPRYHCISNCSYIILGGLGGFGLELVDWMILRGARNIVIISRSGIKNGYQKMRMEIWKSYKANIVVIAGKDVSCLNDCQFIIETATKLGPVDGIFNLAVVLRDALWDNQTIKSFEESFRTKAWATKNLDVLTRKLCPKLRHFVVFSSVSCGRGNAGQTNYGMANSVMERICERRVFEGLPGLAVQWGAIGDVGLVADMQEDNKELVIGGTLQQSIISCLDELDGFLQQNKPVVASMVIAEKSTGFTESLNIVEKVLNIMGLKDLTGVSLTTSLPELGMDSMMSVEIKQTLEREFEVFLSAQDIRNLNFSKLKNMVDEIESNENKVATSDQNVANDEFLGGIQLLAHFIGNIDHSHIACLRLHTQEYKNRDELIMIPGIEGIASVFESLAPKIKAPAICLQLGLMNDTFDSVSGIADYFLQNILERKQNQRAFTMVGYSFGALIAIELARRLEANNLEGRLILIDGAPEPLKILINQEKARFNDNLEDTALALMLSVVSSPAVSQLKAVLKQCKNWDEKIRVFTDICPDSNVNMFTKDQQNVCSIIYKRISAIVSYDTTKLKPINSRITLLKPSILMHSGLEDYGLSKITNGPIEVVRVSGDHVTALDDDKVATVINEHFI